MSYLDPMKRQLAISIVARAMQRLPQTNDTYGPFSGDQLADILANVAGAAIESWNGHIAAEINLLNLDFDNRLRMRQITPHDFFVPAPGFKPKD